MSAAPPLRRCDLPSRMNGPRAPRLPPLTTSTDRAAGRSPSDTQEIAPMRPPNRLAALARGLAPVAALLAATLAPPAHAQMPHAKKVKVLVPAYFYPTWWSGSPWDALNRAAAKI